MNSNGRELAADCIYTALLRLMKTMPYEEIKITDITKKAGVSRMAYYRNYASKDDILLKHLETNIERREAMLQDRQDFSEESNWKAIAEDMAADSIMEYIIKAGLIAQAFPLLKNAMMRIYSNVFQWDMTDDETVLLIYQRVGTLFGYMKYMVERKQHLNTERLAKHLMSLARENR